MHPMTSPATTTLLKKKTNSFTSPPSASPAQKCAADLGIGEQGRAGIGEAVFAADNDEAAGREGEGGTCVLLHHQDAAAAGVDASHLGEHLADVDRAEAGRRLVEQQQLGLAHESAA